MRLSFADSITMMFTNVKAATNNQHEVLPSKETLKLLELVESIERAEKDDSLYGRFSKDLVCELNDKNYLRFAKKVRYPINKREDFLNILWFMFKIILGIHTRKLVLQSSDFIVSSSLS